MTEFYTNIRKYGRHLLYRGYDDNGNPVIERKLYQPTLYTVSHEPSEFKTIEGFNLQPSFFSDMKSALQFIESNSDATNFQVYGHKQFPYMYIADNYKGMEVPYDFKALRIFYLDIEVYAGNGFPEPWKADQKITAITIFDSKLGKYLTWGWQDYTVNLPNTEYFLCSNEVQMLGSFLDYWTKNYPDIVTGWNSRLYDYPYIVNRYKKILGEDQANRLSPFGIIMEKTVTVKRFGQNLDDKTYSIWGIDEIDYMDIYKKYLGQNRESYKLAFIGETELNESKIEYDGSIHEFYLNNFQSYIDYNIKDVELIVKLEQKLKFLELLVEVSYASKVATFEDTLGTTKGWEALIYNHLNDNNIIAPVKGDIIANKDSQFEGAFVRPPQTGKYEWVTSYDVASLYPSVIRQVNIGVETKLDASKLPDDLKDFLSNVNVDNLVNKKLDTSILKKYNVSLSANGVLYKKDKQSFLSELMEKFFNLRLFYKAELKKNKDLFKETKNPYYQDLVDKFNIKQYAMKIFINSGYGALGTQFFQYYSLDNASAVTLTGQTVTSFASKAINNYLNKLLKTDADYLIYGDTDSVMVDFSKVVKGVIKDPEVLADTQQVIDFIVNFSESKIEPLLKRTFEELHEYLNSYTNNIEMARDCVASTGVFIAKKRYFMDVWNKEGDALSEPYLKITGIEIVKTNTPKVCREALKQCVIKILREDEIALQTFVKDFRAKFKTFTVEEISQATSMSMLSKYFDLNDEFIGKTKPINARASNNYNVMLRRHELEDRYERVKDGTKIKMCRLVMPNPVRDDIIGFVDKLPKEFGLENFIDYYTQFDKLFVNPITNITDVINWSPVKKRSLDI